MFEPIAGIINLTWSIIARSSANLWNSFVFLCQAFFLIVPKNYTDLSFSLFLLHRLDLPLPALEQVALRLDDSLVGSIVPLWNRGSRPSSHSCCNIWRVDVEISRTRGWLSIKLLSMTRIDRYTRVKMDSASMEWTVKNLIAKNDAVPKLKRKKKKIKMNNEESCVI